MCELRTVLYLVYYEILKPILEIPIMRLLKEQVDLNVTLSSLPTITSI